MGALGGYTLSLLSASSSDSGGMAHLRAWKEVTSNTSTVRSSVSASCCVYVKLVLAYYNLEALDLP